MMKILTLRVLPLMGLLSFSPVHAAPEPARSPTDYETELARVDRFIAEGRPAFESSSGDSEKALRFVYSLYRRASMTGVPAELTTAEQAIGTALDRFGEVEDLVLLKANLDLKLHRFAEARRDLESVANADANPQAMLILADIEFQEGRKEEARRRCQAAVAKSRTWDALARLAYLTWKDGDFAAADRLYAEAEDEITAKEMRSYAWVELQRGLLELGRGAHDAAAEHYQRAGRAYSGYWLTDAYTAELFAARGDFDKAVALYQSVVDRVPRPELFQELGDLYQFMGKTDLAKPWDDRALAGYLESVQRGEVQYFHHLAAFYSDACEDGEAAVKWARKDLEVRPNFAAYDALAWALYRQGDSEGAMKAMETALASGVQDAHLLYHAGMIHLAAGRPQAGKDLLARAAAINPLHMRFHAHR